MYVLYVNPTEDMPGTLHSGPVANLFIMLLFEVILLENKVMTTLHRCVLLCLQLRTEMSINMYYSLQ